MILNMEHKLLYIVAIVVAILSGSYYYFAGKRAKLEVKQPSNFMYSAQNVQVMKSDEQGQLQMRAIIDNLQQDLKTEQSQMTNITATMFKQGQEDTKFFAKTVNGYDNNQKVILSDGVVVTKITPQGDMQLTTAELTVYPKQKRIETTHQVLVQSNHAMFSSQGLSADLNTGLYEFSSIRGQYAPE